MKKEFWTEDPTALTELLVTDVQWYEQHFRKTSKMLTSLLRHDNSPQLRHIRRNRIQGDVALIDFLLTEVMQRNLPRLCPASLWALAHCMDKQRFTFGTAVGTHHLRGDPDFLMRFNRYLTEEKQVNPAEYEVVTIASCAGHSFVITREIPEGESEDIEYLATRSYAKYGSICHGTHIRNAQSILRTGLDVDYGVRTGLSRRNMIHFCVATNQRPLKRQGLYCYLDLNVAIGSLNLKVMYSKTAQVVLVEDRVPPEALWKFMPYLEGTTSVGFHVSSQSRRPYSATWSRCSPGASQESWRDLQGLTFAPSASCFRTSDFFACDEQPIVIDDDEDTGRTEAASGSADVSRKAPPPLQFKRRPMLKSPPTTRPNAVLKSPPITLTRAPPPVEKYVVPKDPAVVPIFDISDFPMTLPGLPSSIASSPATTLAPETPRVPLPRASSQPKAMEPPPAVSPKPKPPSREQVQIEVDAIMREYDEKRAKRTEEQQRLHDAMLSAIFKSVFEDTVPDSATGIYSSGAKDRMGCDIPKVITTCRSPG